MNQDPGEQAVQLSLGITLDDDCTFDNFYAAAQANVQAVETLRAMALGQGEDFVLVWGAHGAGLSHLLQAVCHDAWHEDRPVQYLPLLDMVGFSAEDICEGLEVSSLVCLDGVDQICGIREWEQALFHLYNKLKDSGHALLVSSHTSPPSLPIVLADLRSRILACVRYHVESLSDSDKQVAMTLRAAARGLDLPGEVARYILNHASRETGELFNVLNRLDEASMQKQRKLTIPFVKEVLSF